jgi:uncharacterized membrane protein YhhN
MTSDRTTSDRLATVAASVFILMGVAYWLLLPFKPYPGSVLLKPAPMLLAAATFLWLCRGPSAWLMALGFIASAAGDAFLDVSRVANLRPALFSFLVAQLVYLAAFLRHGRVALRRRLAWAAPVTLYAIGLCLVLWPTLGSLQVPVVIYFAAIIAMYLAAIRVEARPARLAIGTGLFVLADSLIAINRFLLPFESSTLVIVAIYTTAQWLIFTGMLEVLRER